MPLPVETSSTTTPPTRLQSTKRLSKWLYTTCSLWKRENKAKRRGSRERERHKKIGSAQNRLQALSWAEAAAVGKGAALVAGRREQVGVANGVAVLHTPRVRHGRADRHTPQHCKARHGGWRREREREREIGVSSALGIDMAFHLHASLSK